MIEKLKIFIEGLEPKSKTRPVAINCMLLIENGYPISRFESDLIKLKASLTRAEEHYRYWDGNGLKFKSAAARVHAYNSYYGISQLKQRIKVLKVICDGKG